MSIINSLTKLILNIIIIINNYYSYVLAMNYIARDRKLKRSLTT